ncbi:hypothetical protein M413DRAFT_10230 [Hebeloma cylindrosporum]|uniref:Uncharacterized protein n=1 Tax=Hebeloma cylindrosporum TaxID=76867 RepID=A0A0C2YP04_HEBCY|nr:hypothetical protein M413DRAFT_10230 [Hebeloma cylindrosporum h7]
MSPLWMRRNQGVFKKKKLLRFSIDDAHTEGWRSFLNAPVDITQLENLLIAIDRSYDFELGSIRALTAGSEKLQTFSLEGRLEDPLELADYLHPGYAKTLKGLTISQDLYDFRLNPYLSLVPQLEKIAGKNVLESLSFHFLISIFPSVRDTDLAEWRKLDSILSKSAAFPFLRRVEITIVLLRLDGGLEKELRELGTDQFPLLRHCDGLTFLFEVK